MTNPKQIYTKVYDDKKHFVQKIHPLLTQTTPKTVSPYQCSVYLRNKLGHKDGKQKHATISIIDKYPWLH